MYLSNGYDPIEMETLLKINTSAVTHFADLETEFDRISFYI